MIYHTAQELEKLTGYTRNADQIRWLRRNGIPIVSINSKGEPVVRKDMNKSAVTEPALGPVP